MAGHDPKDPTLVTEMGSDPALREISRQFFDRSCEYRYSYNFRWLGRPIIQYPQDLVAMQEIIWDVRPTLIIETGIAHGGSLIFYASMLELLGGGGTAVGIDITIRQHNRIAIDSHAMRRRIELIEGSSIDPDVVARVATHVKPDEAVLVVLDSNHTHEHVLQELHLYSPFVTRGSYLVVFDTVVEDMPESAFGDRPWGRGNNPKTAVQQFLSESDRFVVDREIQDRLLITAVPDGYLRCVK